MWKCRELWLIFVLGLFQTPDRCESRAVNISNTWTLPYDGFNVFYRFFRDKISWFEADAVCQFHHANLATVDNSNQFDAARNFLKELDVTETVWIGLMRPQSSQRFSWSNSKLLASTSGYWAESLPLIESPLCAVIDPVRDFRWHALRCGGPETASFLCEMNIPDWAAECAIKGIPSLTIQYMADSGTVELSKDCGDEGSIHQVCKAKEDRERIIKELVCKKDKNTIVIEENSITSTDLADTHHKSLQIISNVPSDNNEDNNININPQKIEEKEKELEQNPVQKLIEQFNVEELMHADQPQEPQHHQTQIEEIPKPVKKTTKKAKAFEKKDKSAKKMKNIKMSNKEIKDDDELMMGDQPSLDINDIQEQLPHIKKSSPPSHDIKPTEEIVSTSTTVENIATTDSRHRRDMELISSTVSAAEIIESTTTPSTTTTLMPPTTTIIVTSTTQQTPADVVRSPNLVHPLHVQQTRITPQSIIEETPQQHIPPHTKETNDDHFIPPMLLVKSHYTSTKSHLDEQSPANISDKIDLTTEKIDLVPINSESTNEDDDDDTITTGPIETSENTQTSPKVTIIPPQSPITSDDNEISSTTISPVSKEVIISSTPTTTTTSTPPIQPTSQEQQHHHPRYVAEIKFSSTSSSSNSISSSTENPPTTKFSITTRSTLPAETISIVPQPIIHHNDHIHYHDDDVLTTTHETNVKNDIPISQHHDYHDNTHHDNSHHDNSHLSHQSESKDEHRKGFKNKFSNEENFQPYKPNRRRSLTKPETTTYLKKILG